MVSPAKISTFAPGNAYVSSRGLASARTEIRIGGPNLYDIMASKAMQYVLTERKFVLGKHAGKVMQVAKPTGRRCVDFERFCELVARGTTLNYVEVQAVLNLAADMARELVAQGEIVDYGRLGRLKPTFKSKAVELGQPFNPNVHIERPAVTLLPSKQYFSLHDVSYERVEASGHKTAKK